MRFELLPSPRPIAQLGKEAATGAVRSLSEALRAMPVEVLAAGHLRARRAEQRLARWWPRTAGELVGFDGSCERWGEVDAQPTVDADHPAAEGNIVRRANRQAVPGIEPLARVLSFHGGDRGSL